MHSPWDAKRRVMVKAAPTSPLEMGKTDFALQFLIVPFDAPAQFGDVDERCQRGVFGQGREPVFGGRFFARRPFDEQPLLCCKRLTLVTSVGRAHPQRGKARGEWRIRAFVAHVTSLQAEAGRLCASA